MYIYLFIYRFVRIYGIVNGVYSGMQRVVYAKSLKVLATTSYYLQLIAMNRIKLQMRQLSISLKCFSINVAIE